MKIGDRKTLKWSFNFQVISRLLHLFYLWGYEQTLPKVMLSSLSRWSSGAHIPLSHFKPRSFSSSASSSSSHISPWSGLQAWRQSPVNVNRIWGPNGPQPLLLSTAVATDNALDTSIEQASSLAELGSLVLSTSDPLTKARLSHLAYSRWRRENIPLGRSTPPIRPARPEKPELVRLLFWLPWLFALCNNCQVGKLGGRDQFFEANAYYIFDGCFYFDIESWMQVID